MRMWSWGFWKKDYKKGQHVNDIKKVKMYRWWPDHLCSADTVLLADLAARTWDYSRYVWNGSLHFWALYQTSDGDWTSDWNTALCLLGIFARLNSSLPDIMIKWGLNKWGTSCAESSVPLTSDSHLWIGYYKVLWCNFGSIKTITFT